MVVAAAPSYYRHSSHVGLVGPVLMVVFGAVSAVVLGAAYGYLILYNPFVYFSFLATMLYGGACGAAVGVAAKVAKVRSVAFVLSAGFVVGMACVYVGWVAWIFAYSDQTQFLAADPERMLRLMREVARDGPWSMWGWTPTAGQLHAIWAAEAVLIAVAAVGGSFNYVGASDIAFCDGCRKWTRTMYTSPLLADIADPEAFRARLERGDYSPLTEPARIEMVSPPNSYTRFAIHRCPKCEDFSCLDVKRVDVTLDAKERRQEEETPVVDKLIVGREVYAALDKRYGDASEAIQ